MCMCTSICNFFYFTYWVYISEQQRFTVVHGCWLLLVCTLVLESIKYLGPVHLFLPRSGFFLAVSVHVPSSTLLLFLYLFSSICLWHRLCVCVCVSVAWFTISEQQQNSHFIPCLFKMSFIPCFLPYSPHFLPLSLIVFPRKHTLLFEVCHDWRLRFHVDTCLHLWQG